MRYELGSLTSGTASGSAALEVVPGAARPMSILEMGIFLNAATASIFRVGRPGNTPAGGTSQTATLPVGLTPSGGASVGGIILSGWTTAPTVPAAGNSMRMISLPGAVGNGVVWAWPLGEFIVNPTRSSSWVLWNEQLNGALRQYMKWDE